MDHVAIQVGDIGKSVEFYTHHFGGTVLYQDKTWAFLRVGQGKLALVSPTQHPFHVALRVNEEELLEVSERLDIAVKTHRDGTKGLYLPDPDGNQVELICYPSGETIYESPNVR